MILLFLTACPLRDAAKNTEEVDTDVIDSDVVDTDVVDTAPGDSGDSGADDLVIPADNIATVLGDCEGLWREPPEYPNQLFAGDELDRYTLAEPEAVCNDGTRAVMYVRPYTNEALKDTWEIHVQGGGACASWEDCAVRFCGTGYYDQSKMSSRWAPEQIGAVGILDANAANLLSGANHAYFYYCSSDGWGGNGSTTYTPTEDGYPTYTMFERGHTIIEAGIAELEAGVTADDGVEMPKLGDATVLVWNGTSAGNTGAKRHADWINDRLSSNGTKVYAVFDAANDPPLDVLPVEYQEAGEEVYRTIWENKLARVDYTPWEDQSCVDHYSGTEDEYLCSELSYVVQNHITTPFFVRQDLQDVTDFAETFGATVEMFETYTHAGLLELAGIQETAIEDIPMAPGVYGPNCGQHVALETSDWWRVATVEDDDGTPYTFQDAVLAWYQGASVQIVDDVVEGEGNGPRSDCSALDEGR